MADSIKIPIEILTQETLAEIKKFSKDASASLSKINKEMAYQNELTEKQVKNLRVLSSTQKTFAAAAGLVSAALIVQNKRVAEITIAVLGLGQDLLKATKITDFLGKSFNTAAKTTGVLARAVLLFDKGIIGLALNLSTVSVALYGLGKATDLTNNEFIQFTGSALKLTSVITGALAAGLIALIEGVSRLSINLGTNLVNSTDKAINSFVEFEKKTFVFNRTIEGYNRAFGESIGTAESWTKTVRQVSRATGFTEKALRGAVTEIIATTSAMGFNEDQQRKLLEITTDYASFLGGNVVQTTIEFISALNGQAQSVQKYGVKLGATNLQQKIYAEGLNETFNQLTDNQKIQKRWSSLLKQYTPIAGNAAAVTQTLAGQQKLLENNLTNLEQAYGRGAAIIENNTLAATALNAVVSNVNESVVESAGFFATLGGRILQVGGYILKLTFNLLALYKIINLINFVLGTKFLTNIVNFPFPIFNQSLGGLLKNLGITYLSFNSLGEIVKTIGTIFLDQAKITARAFVGTSGVLISFGKIVQNVFRGISVAVVLASKSFLAFLSNPIVLGIAAITTALYGLYRALLFIEQKTGFFKELGSILKDVFVSSARTVIDFIYKMFNGFRDLVNSILDFLGSIEIIAPVIRKIKKIINEFFDALESLGNSFIKFLTNFKKALEDILKKTVGLVIVGITKVLNLTAKLIAKDPFGIFSKKQVERINLAAERVKALGVEIENLSFDFTLLGKNTQRSVASVNKAVKKVDIAPLVKLQEELKDVGLTDLDVLKKQRDERLKIIEDGLKSEGKSYELAAKLKEQIEKDFSEKQAQILKDSSDKRRNEEKERLDWLEDFRKETLELEKNISDIIGRIGQSASQAIQFAFGGGSTKVEADIDFKLDKLQERLDKELITEAEFKIEKTSLDKAREDLKKNTSIAFGAGLLNGLVQGAKGAEDIIVSSLQAGLDVFVPGLGEALGPLLKVFAQGPEETKKFINEFVQSLPIIIENIILSIPALIEAIADNIDIIIIALVDRVDDIIIALVRAMPRVAVKLAAAIAFEVPLALIKSMPRVALELAKEFAFLLPRLVFDGIKKAFGSLGGSLFKSLGKLIFDGFIAALTGGFNILGSLFKKIFKFDGGGRGAVEKFLGFDFPFIAFSQGGMVGGSARVSGDSSLNDTVPALLSAGEIVLPRSAVKNGASGIIGFLQGLGVNIPRFGFGGFVDGLVGGLGGILGGVFGGLGSLVSGGVGLVSDIFSPVGSLVDHAYGYLQQFEEFVSFPKKWTDILKSLAMIGAEISLKELFKNPFEAITQAVKGALGFFQDSFRQMLKGGLPFAQGGMVPRGFNNDTFNARLSSGEYVIDRSLTGRLSDYLDAQKPQSNGNSMTVVDLLSKILSTMQSEKTINTSVDFNGDTLANIILELNRSNARMA